MIASDGAGKLDARIAVEQSGLDGDNRFEDDGGRRVRFVQHAPADLRMDRALRRFGVGDDDIRSSHVGVLHALLVVVAAIRHGHLEDSCV